MCDLNDSLGVDDTDAAPGWVTVWATIVLGAIAAIWAAVDLWL